MDFKKYFSLLNKDALPAGIAAPEELEGTINDGNMLLGMDMSPETEQPAELPVSGGQALAEEKVKQLPSAPVQRDPSSSTQIEPDHKNAPIVNDYLDNLKHAQQGQIDNSLVNNMLKAGQTIGSALSRTGEKPDYTVANSLQEQAGQGVQNVLQQMKSNKDNIELTDEKRLRDAKSDVSRAFRSTLAKLGIPHTEQTTAWDAKAMGINPQNLLMQDRALEKQMMMLDRKDQKERDSFVTGAQKTLMKPYQQYQKVANARASLEGYLKGDSSGPKDVAILYDFIKGLDPESAVKEGEIQLGKSAMSLMEQYGITARKLTKSDLLSPQFRTAIADIMKAKEQQARSSYEEIAQPFKLHGASRGLNEEDYGKFDYLSAADSKKAAGQQPASVVSEQAPAAGLVERKTKDGRIALFDPTTKQFVKYKDQ